MYTHSVLVGIIAHQGAFQKHFSRLGVHLELVLMLRVSVHREADHVVRSL